MTKLNPTLRAIAKQKGDGKVFRRRKVQKMGLCDKCGKVKPIIVKGIRRAHRCDECWEVQDASK